MRFYLPLTLLSASLLLQAQTSMPQIAGQLPTSQIQSQRAAQNASSSTPQTEDEQQQAQVAEKAAAIIRSPLDKDIDEYNASTEQELSNPLFDQYVKDAKEGKKKDYFIDEKETVSKNDKIEESYLKEYKDFQKLWNENYRPIKSDENYQSPRF